MMNKEEKIIDTCENRNDYWFKSWNYANKKAIDLQQRIDKAIEYLKDRKEDNECCSVCSVMSDRLLEILGGKE